MGTVIPTESPRGGDEQNGAGARGLVTDVEICSVLVKIQEDAQ